MGDSLITIVAIFLAAILMFVFPLMSISERNDDIAQLGIQTAVTEFVDKAASTGKITMDEYSDVKDYVAEHFGNVDGEKLFEYPKIDKQINVLIDEEKIEICAAKNYKQFWGKGLYLVNKD